MKQTPQFASTQRNQLETARSRILVASVALVAAITLCLLFAHQITGVLAARRDVEAEDAHVAAQLASLPTPHPSATPVLVELFTSEGCSSCPPADALLGRLQHEQPVPAADILALEEHVDYWDSLGWHDRFSSHQLTDRQSQYAQRLRLDSNYIASPLKFSLNTPKYAASPNLRIVIFIQRSGQGAILGAASSSLSATPLSTTSLAATELSPTRRIPPTPRPSKMELP